MARLIQPLRFERVFVEKTVWGGRSLERVLGIDLPAGKQIGETWELVDREKENSVVVGGDFDGKSLRWLMEQHREDLLGRSAPTPDGRFPLLVKFLDAAEHLSVQVHPDDAGAERQRADAQSRVDAGRVTAEDASSELASEPKTEAWYFLDATADGGVWCGLRSGAEREAVEASYGSGAVVDQLAWWPVQRGEALMVPGGTVHAIGAGVQLLEVQQNSDTTWRIYDWDRLDSATGEPRDRHESQAAAVTRYDLGPRPPVGEVFLAHVPGAEAAPLARCRHFGMTRLRVTAPAEFDTKGQFQIYVAVEGAGVLISSAAGAERRTDLNLGDTILVPAACGAHRLEPSGNRPLGIVQLVGAA